MNIDNDQSDDGYWDKINAFLDLAKELSKESDKADTSTPFLYAAARFDAFSCASLTEGKENLVSQKKMYIDHWTEMYRIAFEENLNDYISNYEKHSSNPSFKQDDQGRPLI